MAEFEIDRQLLVATFVEEAAEILGAMEQAALALEARPEDAELLRELFRGAHTLKGSAAIAGLDLARDLAHDVEEVLARLRAGALRADGRVVSLLLRAADAVRAAVEAGAAGAPAPERVEAVRAELRAEAGTEPGAGAAAAPAPAGDGAGGAARRSGARTLRVDVGKLDRMLDLAGEIAIARGRLADLLERRGGAARDELLEAHRETDRLYLDLQDLVMRARMVPIGPTFRQHVRTVRDVAAAAGKQARLVLEGEDVEVDTAMIERVRDPLTHLVRNAIDHGIESPAVRAAAGKDPCGTVTLRARHEGGRVHVEVEDDGAGLDGARILERARALGLARDEAGDDAAARLIFAAGLSTAEAVSEISGRGVGLDVVRRNVEALRGAVSVRTGRGAGTAVELRLPLTLALIQGFGVGVGERSYVVPLDAVVECLELPPGGAGAGDGVMNVRGQPLPLVRLRAHFGIAGEKPARESVVVVRDGAARAGLAVDRLVGESQTVVKPLARVLRDAPGVSASAILGDGRVALILDVPGLLADVRRRAATA